MLYIYIYIKNCYLLLIAYYLYNYNILTKNIYKIKKLLDISRIELEAFSLLRKRDTTTPYTLIKEIENLLYININNSFYCS